MLKAPFSNSRAGGSRAFALIVVVLLLLGGIGFLPQSTRAASSGTVSIRLHSCDDGFDGINSDIYGFAQFCHTPMGGVDFAVQYGNVAPAHQTDLDGSWTFTDIPSGSVTVTEIPPVAGWLIRAFCSQYDSTGAPSNYLDAPVGQGSATWNLQDGQSLDCDWYNFPVVTPTQTTVSIRLHGCPDGFDGINADIYGFAQYCHTPIGGVDFTVQYNGLAPSHQTDLDGTWTFTGVTTGVITVTETKPDPSFLIRAFCSQFDTTGPPSNYLEAPAGQGGATWNLKPNQALDCDWYNFPAAAATAATVTIRKHRCNTGYDATGGSIYDLAANCNSVLKGITFTISATSGPPRGGQTGNDGSITWQNIPSGPITIQEELPSPDEVIRVFCNQRKLTGEELGFSEVPASSDGTITNAIKIGYDEFDCDWFDATKPANFVASPTAADATPVSGNATGNSTGNATGNSSGTNSGNGSNSGISNSSGGQQPTVQASVSGSLTIMTYTCDAGFDVFDPQADPTNDCPNTTNDIAFDLAGPNDTHASRNTGQDGEGAATFANLDQGSYVLTETMPQDVDSAFILDCSSDVRDLSGYPLGPALIGANGMIKIALASSENLVCNWYDVPKKTTQTTSSGGTAITITVLDCPGQTVNLAQCTPAASGVSFTLDPTGGSGSVATLQTDDSGVATGNVEPGTYSLTEEGSTSCLVDSTAFNQNGELEVADQEIAVTVYHCGT